MSRYLDAVQVWEWIKWRLPPSLYMEAQQVLFRGPQPTPTDPVVAAGFAEVLNPATTNARRLELLQQLLVFIRDRSP